MTDSFEEYLKVMKNKCVAVCPKCGSYDTDNYDWLGHASCYSCGHVEYEKKFEYKTIGVFT
jgi:Zn ribbon nucleic-acid-binding protein